MTCSLAALQAVLGHGTIAVTERYGTIGDDLVERENSGEENGETGLCPKAKLVRREGIEPSTC